MSDETLTTEQAVELTGLSKDALHKRARRGQLPRPRRAPWNRRYSLWDARAVMELAEHLERVR